MNTNLQLANLALQQYGLDGALLTLSQDMWNTTYCVTAESGQKYNLRICGAALQNSNIVHDELTFLDFVAALDDIRAPKPVRNLDHEFITIVEATERRICCLFEWIEGAVVRESLTDSVMLKMGQATAHLHLAAQAFQFPVEDDPFREGYNYDEQVILQHREWLQKLESEIEPERVVLLNRAIDYVLDKFGQIPKTRKNYGYIHADLNPNNFIVTSAGLDNERVSVIDFEQLGRGYFQYDFAVMKAELLFLSEQAEKFWTNFKAGYQGVTALPFDDDSDLEPFIMTTELNFLDWIYNTPSPHVREHWHDRFHATHDWIKQRLG